MIMGILSPSDIFRKHGDKMILKILSCPCGVMFHMNSIRVGLNSEEIVNGLGYEYLLKMMNDILLNFIY